MGQKRWEDFRFYNKIAPGFEQDVQRMFAQVERSQRAQESWLKGMANPSMPR